MSNNEINEAYFLQLIKNGELVISSLLKDDIPINGTNFENRRSRIGKLICYVPTYHEFKKLLNELIKSIKK